MLFISALLGSMMALVAAQALNIPTRSGSIVSLSSPSVISGSVDYGNREIDRGRDCNTDDDTGDESAVFILNNGASISNAVIGALQLEGIHCKGERILRNVWFRDVCEDSALGNGNVLWESGGANFAKDKVVQYNGRSTVTIRGGTFTGVGKVYRSCGERTNNGGSRNVVIENIKVNGVTVDLVGINSNNGDVATVSGSCGVSKRVCQEYKGVTKGNGESGEVSTTANCRGSQGLLTKLPAC